MERLVKDTVLRNKRVKHPILLVCSMTSPQFKSMGNTFYKPMLTTLKGQPKVSQVEFCPNIVSSVLDIDKRGTLLATRIKQISERYNMPVHLVAHSFSGVDCRAAISLNNLSEHVLSLTTVATPHLGMDLINKCVRFPGLYDIRAFA